MSEHTIKIVDGRLSFIYDDELGDLLDEGDVAVCRVSHVEPADTVIERLGQLNGVEVRYKAGTRGWVADMRPVNGPILKAPDGEGFPTRAEALAAERAWLQQERGL